MTVSKSHKKKPQWLNIIAALFIVASVAMALYLIWQSYQLNATQKQLLGAIESQKQTLIDLKQREQIGDRMKAAEILVQAQDYRRNWSIVVEDLKDAISDRSSIKLNTVSVSPEGMVSVQGSAPDMLSVASLVVLVNRDDRFSDAFISSISQQKDENQSSFGFGATFNYLPANE